MTTKNSIYNSIATDYHLKRKKPWIDFQKFMKYLKKKDYNLCGTTLDLGCANGRNFIILSQFSGRLIGIDNSNELLKIAKKELNSVELSSKLLKAMIQLILSDICYLPIRPNTFHNIFSIATIHHVKSKSKRKNVLAQIYNVLKPSGYLCVTLWRKFQKKFRYYFIKDWFKRFCSYKYRKKTQREGLASFGDKFIPWKNSIENVSYNRFYHFFSSREAKNLLKSFKIREFKKLGGPNKKDNFFILAQKLNE